MLLQFRIVDWVLKPCEQTSRLPPPFPSTLQFYYEHK